MTIDLKTPRNRKQSCFNWKFAVLAAGGILLTAYYLLAGEQSVSVQDIRVASQIPAASAPDPQTAEVAPPEVKREVLKGKIKAGETISSLFSGFFSPREILLLAKECKEILRLSRIRAGNLYEIHLADGVFEKFIYDIDNRDQLIITKAGGDFAAACMPIAYELKQEVIQATILSSLFGALGEAGESPELAISLADIFAWDIDFIRDIRQGDSFKVLVEKRFRDGDFSGYQRILAAEFDNNGEIYKAFLFDARDGQPDYYDENGKSLRKTFLKAPLSFSRISSGYTNSRFHPILKRYKPHRAIDYAAPTGTPIHSVGSGVVTRKAYNKYNGRFVRIRHNSIYETHYNHMSRFGKGIQVGTRVAQGQTIGFVGSSGLATGPHLDFRMYKNGASINPLTIKAPSAAPVPAARMAAFKKVQTQYAGLFDVEAPVQISSLKPDNSIQPN